MDEKKKAKEKKPAKKLELNKETIQELSEGDLDNVAGGVGGTKKNCRSVVIDCPTGPDPTILNCPPPRTADTCGICDLQP